MAATFAADAQYRSAGSARRTDAGVLVRGAAAFRAASAHRPRRDHLRRLRQDARWRARRDAARRGRAACRAPRCANSGARTRWRQSAARSAAPVRHMATRCLPSRAAASSTAGHAGALANWQRRRRRAPVDSRARRRRAKLDCAADDRRRAGERHHHDADTFRGPRVTGRVDGLSDPVAHQPAAEGPRARRAARERGRSARRSANRRSDGNRPGERRVQPDDRRRCSRPKQRAR